MKSDFPHLLLIAVLLSIPAVTWTQVTQPEGIYTNFIQFKYEDPDFPVEVAMKSAPEIAFDFTAYHPIGIKDHVDGNRPYDRVWAVVSDSALYLNMSRYFMGAFYLKFEHLEAYTYFRGRRILGREEKDKY